MSVTATPTVRPVPSSRARRARPSMSSRVGRRYSWTIAVAGYSGSSGPRTSRQYAVMMAAASARSAVAAGSMVSMRMLMGLPRSVPRMTVHDRPFGRYLEDFVPGDVYKHWPGKTVTEYDDHLFCMI